MASTMERSRPEPETGSADRFHRGYHGGGDWSALGLLPGRFDGPNPPFNHSRKPPHIPIQILKETDTGYAAGNAGENIEYIVVAAIDGREPDTYHDGGV